MGSTAAEKELTHRHDPWQCPEHIDWCDCPDLDGWLCNPYWVNGYCPDSILRMPVGKVHAMPDALHGPSGCCGLRDSEIVEELNTYDFYSSDPSQVTCTGKTGNS